MHRVPINVPSPMPDFENTTRKKYNKRQSLLLNSSQSRQRNIFKQITVVMCYGLMWMNICYHGSMEENNQETFFLVQYKEHSIPQPWGPSFALGDEQIIPQWSTKSILIPVCWSTNLGMRTWANYLPSLCFHFFICKRRVINTLTNLIGWLRR